MSLVQVSLQVRVSSIRSVLNRGIAALAAVISLQHLLELVNQWLLQSDGPPIAEERTGMPIRFAQVSCATGNQ